MISLLSFFLLGLHWWLFEVQRNLKKFPRGSLAPFGAPPHFFFAPRGLPRRLRSVPEGSRRGFGAILKMLKNHLFLLLFRPWGDLWAVQGGHGASCWPSRGSSQRIKGTRSSYRRGSLGPLERCPLLSEGSLEGPRAPKWSLGAISGRSWEVPDTS